MSHPTALAMLRALAEHEGVCVRPVLVRRIDRATGATDVIEVPCGARLAADCKPCAERLRRLRVQQVREGWHLDTEPAVTPQPPTGDVLDLVRRRAQLEFDHTQALTRADWDRVAHISRDIDKVDAELATMPIRGQVAPDRDHTRPPRRRSTRRRQDAPDLPRLPVKQRTVGTAYTTKTGKTYRPSMLLTITLPSHGPVHTAGTRSALRPGGGTRACGCGALHAGDDPQVGTPLDPASYDYRSAALDAIHFSRVLDRFWQNLRRAAGWNLQYAGAVELQRRLAPHVHFCMRGTLPRALVRQVAAATYHHVWWPSFDQPRYTTTRPPTWDEQREGYTDPDTGTLLPTWDQALDALEHPDAAPAYIARLGRIDLRGIAAGTDHAERAIGYVTKYLTKELTDHTSATSDPQQAHADRLAAELAVLPCSPTCANWLLYGVQPDRAKPGLVPGRCSGKVHQPRTLGFTGRRMLITRQWSGKTLADHRADNRAWVRTILTGALADDDQAVTATDTDPDRYRFELARPDDPDVAPYRLRILRAVGTRQRWRQALHHARAGPTTSDPVPATTP